MPHPRAFCAIPLEGTKLQVQRIDGSKEEACVRFPHERIRDLVDIAGDELKVIEACCGRPPGWTKTLTDESIMRLGRQCILEEASFYEPFAAWMAKRAAKLKKH